MAFKCSIMRSPLTCEEDCERSAGGAMITATRKRNKLRGSLSRFIGRQSLIIVVRLYSVQANASSCRSHQWIALLPWRFCLKREVIPREGLPTNQELSKTTSDYLVASATHNRLWLR